MMALMSKRTIEAYEAILKHLLELCPFPQLKFIMSDYEGPMRTAIKNIFGLDADGCNVHYDRVILSIVIYTHCHVWFVQ